jgi:hypothetical protein
MTACLTIDSFNPVSSQGLQASNLYNLKLVIFELLLLLIVVILVYSLITFRAALVPASRHRCTATLDLRLSGRQRRNCYSPLSLF